MFGKRIDGRRAADPAAFMDERVDQLAMANVDPVEKAESNPSLS